MCIAKIGGCLISWSRLVSLGLVCWSLLWAFFLLLPSPLSSMPLLIHKGFDAIPQCDGCSTFYNNPSLVVPVGSVWACPECQVKLGRAKSKNHRTRGWQVAGLVVPGMPLLAPPPPFALDWHPAALLAAMPRAIVESASAFCSIQR